jgi:ATP diphosphatase
LGLEAWGLGPGARGAGLRRGIIRPMKRTRRKRRPSTTGRNRTSARPRQAASAFARLVRVMQTLRSPDGCPWDREQTHESLRPHLLEETYEAIETIDRGDLDALPAELGDVLFQCVFHAQIAAEEGRFDITDAVSAITEKLIRRHPHVFTASGRPLTPATRRRSRIQTAIAVKEQWEQIKAGEQARAGAARRVLKGVPTSLPALQRAHEIGRRVSAVGFDWARAADVLDKMDEEVRELRAAVEEGPARTAEEMGDLLFSLANLARKLGVEPESALRSANDKFTRRFDALEAWFEARGRSVHGATLDEMETAWGEVKSRLKGSGLGGSKT